MRLERITVLPLHSVDKMHFRPGGEPIPRAEYLAAHEALIGAERWIIDGFGTEEPLWQRFAAADTPGWPEGSPLWSSSLQSYRVISACHREMTPKYRALVIRDDGSQQFHRLRSPAAIRAFLAKAEAQQQL